MNWILYIVKTDKTLAMARKFYIILCFHNTEWSRIDEASQVALVLTDQLGIY